MHPPNAWRACVVAAVLSAGCAAHHPRRDLADRGGRRGDELVRHAAAVCAAARPERPDHAFTSDGCSMWPGDGPAACCVEHDVAYWCGGSAAARVQADAAFGACMRADARHSRHLGDLMYWSVRIGGTPWLPFPWRWGYGFAGVRGYDARP